MRLYNLSRQKKLPSTFRSRSVKSGEEGKLRTAALIVMLSTSFPCAWILQENASRIRALCTVSVRKDEKVCCENFFCSPYRNTASNNGRGSACCARREWEPTSTGRPSQRRSGGRLPLTLTKHFMVN